MPTPPDSSIDRHVGRAAGFALACMCLIGILFAVFLALPAFDPIDVKFTVETYLVPLTAFLPESRERTQFIFGTLAFPPLLLIAYGLIHRLLRGHRHSLRLERAIYPWGQLGALASLAALIGLCVRSGDGDFFWTQSPMVQHPLWTAVLWLASMGWVVREHRMGPRVTRLIAFVQPALVIAALALIFGHNLIGLRNINSLWSMAIHFSAVFNPMVHVFNGKAILIDFINQYGLYPHLLEPLFRLTGLSVLGFSAVMVLLLVVSYSSLYAFLRQITAHRSMAFLGFAGLLYYSYYCVRFLNPEDLYYQYQPIRLIFPCVLILAAWRYFRDRQGRRLYVPIMALASLAVLWNLDTGLVVFLTWLLTLCYGELLSGDLKSAIKRSMGHMLVGLLALAVTIGGMCGYMWARYGTLPHIASFLAYQKYFYISGFAMIPMPAVHLWILTILVYGLGLLLSLAPLIERTPSEEAKPRLTLTFLISILGVGLFSYYQGRSHNYVLTAVWYPAFLLLTMWGDRLLSQIEERRIPWRRLVGPQILLGAVVLLFSSSLVGLLAGYPRMIEQARVRFEEAVAPSRPIEENLALLARHHKAGERLLALSYNSGVYYLATGTAPSLKVAGLSETILRRDYREIEGLLEKKAFDLVALDRGLFYYNAQINQALFFKLIQHYYPVARTDNAELCLLRPRPSLEPFELAAFWSLSRKDAVVHAAMDSQNLVYFMRDGRRGYMNGKIEAAPLQLGADFSIQLIVKPHDQKAPNACIASTHPGYGNYEGFALQRDASSFRFGFGDGKRWLPSMQIPMPGREWSFLSIVTRGRHLSVYRNGTLVSTLDAGGTMKNSAMPFIIGNWIQGDRPFNGELAELQVVARALSEAEIANDWASVRRHFAP